MNYIRRVLLASAKGVLGTLALVPLADASAAGVVLSCKSSADCSSDVTVSSSGPGTCQVDWKYDSFAVAVNMKPKLLWVLKPDSTAKDTYSFHVSDGITLRSEPENDTNQDLNDNATDVVPQNFRWMEVHTRPMTLRFKLVVSGKNSSTSFRCTTYGNPADEYTGKIVNE